MEIKVTPDKLSKAILEELEKYTDEKSEEIVKIVDEIAVEAKNTLRRTSPKKTGAYRKSWRIKSVTDKNGRHVRVVYSLYESLTNWLEHGHKNVRAGKWTPGIVHIAPVEEQAKKDLLERIEEVLKQ